MSQPKLVMVTPEIAISPVHLQEDTHHSLPPTQTGGLGYYMQTLLCGMHDENVPTVFIAPLPRWGYYKQQHAFGGNGDQIMAAVYGSYPHYRNYIEGVDKQLSISIGGSEVKVNVHPYKGNKIEFRDGFFLDTDHDENHQFDRWITRYLYGGTSENGNNTERRIALAIVLGVGSVELSRAYGLKPAVYHLNESWTAFHVVYRVGLLMKEKGLDMESAIKKVQENTVATSHTPVAAGNPTFRIDDVLKVGHGNPGFTREVLERLGGDGHGNFNMAYANLRGTRMVNSVSKKHLDVMNDIYSRIDNKSPVIAITNSASRRWIFEEFRDPASIKDAISGHNKYHDILIDAVHRHYPNKRWSRNILTAAYARRFTAYKRPGLILLTDLEWTKKLMESNDIQLIYMGKPNPDEVEMVHVYNELLKLSYQHHNLAVLPGYEYTIMRKLQAGVHLWLNNPAFPNEACGTSGMKPLMMMGINMSVPDGWVFELDPELYFRFGTIHIAELSKNGDPWHIQWHHDYASFQRKLTEVITMFKHQRDAWWEMAWQGLQARDHWLEGRMAREYIKNLYQI